MSFTQAQFTNIIEESNMQLVSCTPIFLVTDSYRNQSSVLKSH